jgi:hypothetical protein
MKKSAFVVGFLVLSVLQSVVAAPYLAIFGEDGENKVYHFYIDESAGETNSFRSNSGRTTDSHQAEIYTTLNRRIRRRCPRRTQARCRRRSPTVLGAHIEWPMRGGGRFR